MARDDVKAGGAGAVILGFVSAISFLVFDDLKIGLGIFAVAVTFFMLSMTLGMIDLQKKKL